MRSRANAIVIVGDCGRRRGRRRSRLKLFWKWTVGALAVRAKRKAGIVVELEEGQFVDMEVIPLARRGGPGAVDGDIVWALGDPSMGTVTVDETSANKRKARYTQGAVAAVQNTDITASGDGKEGAEIVPFVFTGQIVGKPVDNTTVTGEIRFGTVQDPAA